MEQWNILGKMEQWDTSKTEEDIGKDLNPYLDYVIDKLNALDTSIINELDTLKKILPRVETLFRDFHIEVGSWMETYQAAMDELYLLPGHNNDKLKKVLNDQTGLTKDQKNGILDTWKKHSKYHWGCLPQNDSSLMEECIRTKSATISYISDRDEEFDRRVNEFYSLVFRTREAIKIFPVLTHPSSKKDKRASSTHQLKRRKSTKHKRLKSTSSPKASGQ